MGPTAVGKTDLAVALVDDGGFEIVSVDSAMIYRGMDIGTGKPDAETLARAPHRLIDVRDPVETYSAAEFARDARAAIGEIRARGLEPLLVGGTGLYFRALREGLSTLPAADARVRAELAREAARLGWPAMHSRLTRLDAASASRIHPNDPQRIQRALEVHALTGRPMSEQLADASKRAPGLALRAVAIQPTDRARLHARIAERFAAMLERGLVAELEGLRARWTLEPSLPSMRAVGYRQVWEHLEGRSGREEMIRRAEAATRQLARRQLTWLRAQHGLERLAADRVDLLDAARVALAG